MASPQFCTVMSFTVRYCPAMNRPAAVPRRVGRASKARQGRLPSHNAEPASSRLRRYQWRAFQLATAWSHTALVVVTLKQAGEG